MKLLKTTVSFGQFQRYQFYMTDNRQKPERTHGLAHVLAASRYSLAGLRLVTKEAAFRQEILGFALILGLFLILGAGSNSYLTATILFLLLIATEALNTSIEVVVDHLSPEWSKFAKDAKDLGSFAVACLLLANGLNVLFVIVTSVQAGSVIFF